MSSGVQITGLKELQQNLKTLSDRTQRKIMRPAVSAGATPILQAERAGVQNIESGLLKKSLGKRVVTNSKKNSVTAVIGPRKNISGEYKGKLRKPSRYAHLVENAHINRAGEYVPGHAFVNPALPEAQGEALNILADKLGKGIEREAARSAA